MVLSLLAPVAAGGLSFLSNRSEGRKNRRLSREQQAIGQTAFSPINFFGPGGGGITFGPQGPSSTLQPVGGPPDPFMGFGEPQNINDLFRIAQAREQAGNVPPPGTRFAPGTDVLQSDLGQINVDLGDLGPLREGLVGLAGGNLAGAGTDFSGNINAAFQNLLGASGNFGQLDTGVFDALQQGGGFAFGQATQDLGNVAQNPFAQGLQNQLLGAAGGQFADAAGGFRDVRDETLGLLREQARPQEERAFSNLQDTLFSQGRLGTTGGSQNIEAFARGLGQVDLDRQLQAGAEARRAQNQALNVGSTFLGQGSDIRGLQDRLLSGAVDRFSGISDLNRQLSESRFDLTSRQAQNQFNRAGSLLDLSIAPQLLQQRVQGGFLDNLASSLGQVSGIGADSRADLGQLLNFMNAQANSRTGGNTTITPFNSGASTAFAQLAGALAPQGGVFNALGDLFGRGGGSGGNNVDDIINAVASGNI